MRIINKFVRNMSLLNIVSSRRNIALALIISVSVLGQFASCRDRAQSTNTAPVSTNIRESSWADRKIGNILFECPYRLRPDPEVDFATPAELRDLVLRTDIYTNSDISELDVRLIRVEYAEGVQTNYENSVTRAMLSTAIRTGDSDPQLTLVNVSLGGLPALRVSYHGQKDDEPFHAEAVGLGLGQEVWCFQIQYRDATHADAVNRILESIRIDSAETVD